MSEHHGQEIHKLLKFKKSIYNNCVFQFDPSFIQWEWQTHINQS